MQEEAKELQSKNIILNSQVGDSSGKIIFDNHELCSQFIRDYVDMPYLKEITADDIEDVSEQFVPLFAEERNADRVKKVHIRECSQEEIPFFVISLIEHKTRVDFNVCMQIFRYMIYIWESYEKEMEKKQEGISKRKDFRYPPILPIVYYEGRHEWSAPMDFKSRVNKSEVFGEYIPDFKYYLVPLQKYSNEELLSREDEISLIMMINKMQTLEDLKVFRELPADKLDKILENTPRDMINIIVDILMTFQLKANVPLQEAEANVRKVREKKVARLFEDADFGDIQAMRRERAELKEQIEKDLSELTEMKLEIEEAKKEIESERQKAESERQKAESERQKAESERQKAESERQKAESERQKAEKAVESLIVTLKSLGVSPKLILEQLTERFELDQDQAEAKMKYYL